jgi:hypothetical protein
MWSKPEFPNPEKLVHLSVGLASPLWPAFYGAAMTGLTVWSFGAVVRAARNAAATEPTPPATVPVRVEPAAPVTVTSGPDGAAPRKRATRARKTAAVQAADPSA